MRLHLFELFVGDIPADGRSLMQLLRGNVERDRRKLRDDRHRYHRRDTDIIQHTPSSQLPKNQKMPNEHSKMP